jgi:hypothetical protein
MLGFGVMNDGTTGNGHGGVARAVSVIGQGMCRAVAAVATVSAVGVCALNAPAPLDLVPVRSGGTVNLLATQAAITMNGTFTPDVTPEFMAAVTYNYIEPLLGFGYTGVPLTTPEQVWPLSGLTALTYNDSTRIGYQLLAAKYREIVKQNTVDGAPNTPMLVFGYSQSALIAALYDEGLGDERAQGGAVPPTTFLLVGNTNIPNGGIMSRFGGGGLTPWTPVIYEPTKTGNLTYNVLRQYDPFADFPKYPLNALATVNSLLGYLLHFTLPISGNPAWLNPVINILNNLITPISLNPASPDYVKPIVSQYEDTIYQFVPTARLPLLSPLYAVGLTGLADALDPVFRPLIEAGYDRSDSFGVPTPAVWGPSPNIGVAIKQSWEAFVKLFAQGGAATASSAPLPAADVAPGELSAVAAGAAAPAVYADAPAAASVDSTASVDSIAHGNDAPTASPAVTGTGNPAPTDPSPTALDDLTATGDTDTSPPAPKPSRRGTTAVDGGAAADSAAPRAAGRAARPATPSPAAAVTRASTVRQSPR